MALKGEKKARGRGRPIQKGQVLNPTGRPKIPQELRDMAKAACPEAILIAVRIMKDEEEATRDRLKAVEIVLNRGYGTPMQSVELSNSSNEQLKILVEYVSKKE
jgi:hypothetical protein